MSEIFIPSQVISGGQTGVDRAALDWAIGIGVPHGGWCPQGRRAEDGPLDAKYLLQELPSPNYADRTRRNVEDSDATLILYGSKLEGGTLLTARHAEAVGKPFCKVRLHGPKPIRRVREWLDAVRPQSLNVAGPRGSTNPRIYSLATAYLHELFGTAEGKLFEV